MKNDVILACKYIIRHTIFNVQASYCGTRVPDGEIAIFESRAYELIKNAKDCDIEEAFDDCVLCGLDDVEVSSNDVLCHIGNKAATRYESLTLDSVHVIKEA